MDGGENEEKKIIHQNDAMRFTIILCILAYRGPVARGQLNFMGNPLTENTDYMAEESHFAERNEPRTIGVSNVPFASSPSHNVVSRDDERFSRINNDKVKTSVQVERATQIPIKNDKSAKISSPVTDREKIGSSPKTSIPQTPPEGRQFSDYSVESRRPLQPQGFAPSGDSPISIERSQPYGPSNEFPQQRNPSYAPYNTSPVTLASGDALNKFLQSRTPEESQMALQNYFQTREYANQGFGRSGEANDGQRGPQISSAEYALQNDPIRNQMLQQEVMNSAEAISGSAMSYSPLITRHSPPRWHKVGFQSRQDLSIGGPGRRAPQYRGQVAAMGGGRIRQGNPWYQSRIGPGAAPGYRTIFSAPPPPQAAVIGKRKPPPELIYTKPPGFLNGPSSDVIPYEDVSRWRPNDQSLPPQKNLLYSQLYAQSYDPHYYNYIAKTGKVKPWLYGKLGETKEKSIWWELFSGFKKHGMKNMMNPMFLLGMTIPTLTLMLTALVQKRSLGRSSSGGHVTQELIEEYARRLRDAIECNEKRVNDSNSSENKCW